MTVFTTQWACRNRAISDTSAETNGRAAGATSAGFMSGILSTQVSLFPPGANGCRYHSRASGAAICASAKAALGVAWGARRKPGPASPANMSKRGLSARHSVPNQTLSWVNFRLPKGNPAAGNPGRPGGYGGWGRVPCREGGYPAGRPAVRNGQLRGLSGGCGARSLHVMQSRRMGGAKRYPSMPAQKVMGFASLYPSYDRHAFTFSRRMAPEVLHLRLPPRK